MKITENKHITLKRTKKFTLLQHIEQIVEAAKDSGFGADFFEKAKPHIDFLAKKLKITQIQAALFSLFMDRSNDNNILISEISEFVKCRNIKILQYMKEIDGLVNRQLIRCRRTDHKFSYRVPLEVIEAITQNEAYQPISTVNVSIEKFFTVLNKLFTECIENELTYSLLEKGIEELIDNNMHLDFCKKLHEFLLDDLDKILFLYFCYRLEHYDDNDFAYYELVNIFKDEDFRQVKKSLKHKESELFELNLIECVNDNGFEDRDRFCLTDKAKNELLGELNLKENQAKNKKDLLAFSSLAEKTMFYNEKEHTQIQQLTELLREDNFINVKNRLKEKGMRTGFACLFHGAPGTGKTETVYQIARQTQRDILLVDISQTKSMWFGESEKKIKEVFLRYKYAVENSKIAPILLFNEADAVISKRKDVTSGNVAQTENAIQNIILQEMENLEGIMIATTNLTANLDKAFERRFLYKIEFAKPNPDAKKHIWQSIIPAISIENAENLSTMFDFSGGQIENIARKCTVESIISGGEPKFEMLVNYCKNEKLEKEHTKIGFY